ncbi:MAG: hypothetical protein EP338_04965 [Bacteroidetes bacterium]|nr:MAG: hypothetical protein EP338_04965 [Bacteroidota bacterium]
MRFFVLFFSGFILLMACQEKGAEKSFVPFKQSREDFLSKRKVKLGKELFFDKRLSLDGTISCANCHQPERAFTDGRPKSQGIKGRMAMRNAPSLLNVGFAPVFMFDAEVNTLEKQVIVPIQDHNEMGISMKELITRLQKIDHYQQEAQAIFKRDFDPWVLTRSIAAYERTLVSFDSDYDRFSKGELDALSEQSLKGWEIFQGRGRCISCHPPPYFTNFEARNNGVTSLKDADWGRYRIAQDSSDIGKFKVPGVRNIAVTAPYMHDGRMKTLREVLEHYVHKGNSYNRDSIIDQIQLSPKDLPYLESFLKQLSGKPYQNQID